MSFITITVEGGLFPSDLLERIALGEVEGQRPADFGPDVPPRLSDEIQSAFSDINVYWESFRRRLAHAHESLTTITRESWVLPLLERLGFQLVFQRSAAQVGSESYAISHRAGEADDAPPVHVVAFEQPLDRRAEPARRSPHALVQEYLNRSDALWGLITNGEKLRLLRASARLAGPAYLEVDLRALIEGNHYNEFVLVYRLLHRSRFPQGSADAHECRLERYYQQGLEEGGRVRDRLRDGVEAALRELGTAFLVHADSEPLRAALRSGRLSAEDYYRQLLRLVYRLLFLFVVEERKLIFPPGAEHADRQSIYTDYYSLSRLRERCERYVVDDRWSDLWQSLLQTFRLFRDVGVAQQLGLAALDGELFGELACPDLERAGCENARLLSALRQLSTFKDEKVRRRVNYAALDVEELGSVYESLLDYRPHVELEGTPRFDLVAGSERKQTGSYYTPRELVNELVKSALEPVMAERLAQAKTREEREQALLDLRVCDPASGSGHFLLAAARRIGRELAHVRSGEEEPPPEAYRQAVRDVIRTCIYAVDKNPLAVDLCKVALWLESHEPGLPLAFLDHHVKCGDSLVGVFDLDVLHEGIPDEAYTPVTGDEKQAAAYYKKRNRAERTGQMSFDAAGVAADPPPALAGDFQTLATLDDRTPADVQAKADLYEALRAQDGTWWTYKVACDLWTAAFFTPLEQPGGLTPRPGEGLTPGPLFSKAGEGVAPKASGGEPLVPTTDIVRRALRHPQGIHQQVAGEALALAQRLRFFHWPLEFPEVFLGLTPRPPRQRSWRGGGGGGAGGEAPHRGGFDVVLGNPPWERIKLQEQEFFAGRDPEIARAPNKAARERLIKELPKRNPALAAEFAQAKRAAEAESGFVRHSGRYPLCGRGDINTYAVFAETMRALLGPGGRAGIIVPTGIATDDTTKHFFRDLVEGGALVSLYDFENRLRIFPGIDSRMKFCLLTLRGLTPRPPLQLRWRGGGAEGAGGQARGGGAEGAGGQARGGGAEGAGGEAVPGTGGEAAFAFFLQRTSDLRDPERVFTLTAADLALLNPNTRTCPIFRTRRDAELTKAIYRRVPVLIKEGPPEENPWGIDFRQGLFNMTSDSDLFRTREQLEGEGWRLEGNVFVRGLTPAGRTPGGRTPAGLTPVASGDTPSPAKLERGMGGEAVPGPGDEAYLPLYEAKMLHQFDHRWATYEAGRDGEPDTRDVVAAEKADPAFVVQPRYWVPAAEVILRSSRVPDIVRSAYRRGDEKLAGKALALWFAGYYLNRHDEASGAKLLRNLFRYQYVPEVAIHGLDVQTMEKEYPLREDDLALLDQADTALALAEALIRKRAPWWLLGWRDVTNTTNERTAIASVLPRAGVAGTCPLFIPRATRPCDVAAFYANLCCHALDYVARQKIGGVHLSHGYLKQLPILPPATYGRRCPWSPGERLRDWLALRVLELTYTAWDLKPFAEDVWGSLTPALLRTPSPASLERGLGGEAVPALGGEAVPAPGGEAVPGLGGEAVPGPGGEAVPAPGGAALSLGMASAERRRLCRELRQRQTPAEEFFWELVRDRRFDGLKFRRQHPLGTFVVDFYCPELKLAVELDGGVHRDAEQRRRDRERDGFLTAQGIRVVRITNAELLADPEGVLERLRARLTPVRLPADTPSPAELERGPGGEAVPGLGGEAVPGPGGEAVPGPGGEAVPPPFRWDEERRFLLRCELDAAFFHLYGIARDDVAYIMDTFPIVRRKDEERHGEYRTKRVILEIYDAMAEAQRTGVPYRTRLEPPPADRRVAHAGPGSGPVRSERQVHDLR